MKTIDIEGNTLQTHTDRLSPASSLQPSNPAQVYMHVHLCVTVNVYTCMGFSHMQINKPEN